MAAVGGNTLHIPLEPLTFSHPLDRNRPTVVYHLSCAFRLVYETKNTPWPDNLIFSDKVAQKILKNISENNRKMIQYLEASEDRLILFFQIAVIGAASFLLPASGLILTSIKIVGFMISGGILILTIVAGIYAEPLKHIYMEQKHQADLYHRQIANPYNEITLVKIDDLPKGTRILKALYGHHKGPFNSFLKSISLPK